MKGTLSGENVARDSYAYSAFSKVNTCYQKHGGVPVEEILVRMLVITGRQEVRLREARVLA